MIGRPDRRRHPIPDTRSRGQRDDRVAPHELDACTDEPDACHDLRRYPGRIQFDDATGADAREAVLAHGDK
jgi:hypothetical protein